MAKQDLEQIREIVREETSKIVKKTIEEELVPMKNDIGTIRDELGGVRDEVSGMKDKIGGVKTDTTNIKGELGYVKQKMDANHREVMIELAKIKKMESEDVSAFAGDVDNLKRRVTKLEKVAC